MSTIEILLNGKIIGAFLAIILLAIVVEIISRKILDILDDVSVSEWLFEKIFIPLFRALELMTFILLAYPVLFGLNEAPPISQLLSEGSHRINTLLNILFVLPLLLSLLPIFGRMPSLLLPVQGIAGSTLIFSWMQAALQRNNIHYVPNIMVIVVIILLAIVSHAIAKWVALHLSNAVNRFFQIDDGQKIVYRIVVVVAQLPVILIYTTGLGRQL
ncbi:MAG: hypothetical protein AMJ55_11510 [Gammaproteobacteria bacterium SG8_15]|nr:MAG: hypothetical protein AMJ55_11510 [Gammaproteobacteria bacterium SG8_15]